VSGKSNKHKPNKKKFSFFQVILKKNKLILILFIILVSLFCYFFVNQKSNLNNKENRKTSFLELPIPQEENEIEVEKKDTIDSVAFLDGSDYINSKPEEIFNVLHSFIYKYLSGVNSTNYHNGYSCILWQNYSQDNLFFAKDTPDVIAWGKKNNDEKTIQIVQDRIFNFFYKAGFTVDKSRGCKDEKLYYSCFTSLKIFVKNNQYFGLTEDALFLLGDVSLIEKRQMTISRLYSDSDRKYSIGCNWDISRDSSGQPIEYLVWTEGENQRYIAEIHGGFRGTGFSWFVYYQKSLKDNTIKKIFESNGLGVPGSDFFTDSCLVLKNHNISEYERNSLVEVLRKQYCSDCVSSLNNNGRLSSAAIEKLMQCDLSK